MPAALTPTPYIARPTPAPRARVGYCLADLIDDVHTATGLGPGAVVALSTIAAAFGGAFIGFLTSF